MRNIKLVVEYDGSSFCGWARQASVRTVAGLLEGALERLCGHKVRLVAASRTDAGVHAAGQVVNFKTSSGIPAGRIAKVLCAMLPGDVTVREAREVPAAFDARRSAKGKLYSYFVLTGTDAPPLIRRVSWHVNGSLCLSSMRGAAKKIVGKRDFSSFTVTDKRRKLLNPFRDVRSIRMREGTLREFFGDLGRGHRAKAIRMDFSGDSFLYKMIRSIVGTIVEVGTGKRSPKDIEGILAARSRAAAGRTAPASGLTLIKVIY